MVVISLSFYLCAVIQYTSAVQSVHTHAHKRAYTHVHAHTPTHVLLFAVKNHSFMAVCTKFSRLTHTRSIIVSQV